jgi:hypothetical protein
MRALGLLLVLMTACAADDALTDSKIAAAKRRWDQSEPSSYEMTLSQTCFCIRPGLVVVTITNGIVVSAVGGNGGLEIPNDELRLLPTVDELFDRIVSSRLAGRTVDAAFHPLRGYPVRIEIDEHLLPADGGVVYQISSVRAR